MLFNSLTFIVFFVVVLALYQLPIRWRLKKAHLLVASYLFYAAWNPPFVILLWIVTLIDWFIARKMASTESLSKRKLLLILSLVSNLGILSYFKYGDFLLANFVRFAEYFSIQFTPAESNIVLPVGISFYTFVTLSYTFDVYRRKIEPEKSFLNYALLVTFFPHLLAGPILRAKEFLPQCIQPKIATAKQLGWGLTLMVLGLFEKSVLADGFLAPVSDAVFAMKGDVGYLQGWIGTFAFTLQVFFDFSGYSLCAIGAAMCFGFAFPDNFRFPFAAIGFSDFWRRWHMTLSRWLRDYLYISLGGNRKGRIRTYFNLFITMFLGGLWHGAGWNFIIWGGLQGSYLILERIAVGLFSGFSIFSKVWARFLLAQLTFFGFGFSLVLFRSAGAENAFEMYRSMFSFKSATASLFTIPEAVSVLTIGVLVLVFHWYMRDSNYEALATRLPSWLFVLIVSAMLALIILIPGDKNAFVYFQF